MKANVFAWVTVLFLLCIPSLVSAERETNQDYEMYVPFEMRGDGFVDPRTGMENFTATPLILADIPTKHHVFLASAKLTDSDGTCNVYFLQGATSVSVDASVVVYWIALEYDAFIARIPIFYDFQTGYIKQLGVFVREKSSIEDLTLSNQDYEAHGGEYAWMKPFIRKLDIYDILREDMQRAKYVGRLYHVRTEALPRE